jgi:hypothetical protein
VMRIDFFDFWAFHVSFSVGKDPMSAFLCKRRNSEMPEVLRASSRSVIFIRLLVHTSGVLMMNKQLGRPSRRGENGT